MQHSVLHTSQETLYCTQAERVAWRLRKILRQLQERLVRWLEDPAGTRPEDEIAELIKWCTGGSIVVMCVMIGYMVYHVMSHGVL